MSTLEITTDLENKLLSRREVTGTFFGGNGFITRQSAAEAIAAKLGSKKENVQVISLKGKFGNRDLVSRAYVFDNSSSIKKQLSPYLVIRQLPKEERKKAREESKKAKEAASQAAGAAPAASGKGK